jgi:diguanylate cyclase (GGDEF)-like protein
METNLYNPYQQESIFGRIPEEISIKKWQNLLDLIALNYSSPGAWLNQANLKGIETIISSRGEKNNVPPGSVIKQGINVYCKHVIQDKKTLYIPNADLSNEWNDSPEYIMGYKSYIGVPIQWPNGDIFGTLCAMDTKESYYSDLFVNLLEQLKLIIDSDLQNMKLLRKLKEKNINDELTGIYNRRGFIELSKKSLKLANRNNLYISMTNFDLTDLKFINKTHGYEAGDILLKSFANALQRTVRCEDIIARLGGDEFVLLCFQKTPVNDDKFVARLQKAFETMVSENLNIGNPSFIFSGKIFSPMHEKKIERMIFEVNALMYAKKQKLKPV